MSRDAEVVANRLERIRNYFAGLNNTHDKGWQDHLHVVPIEIRIVRAVLELDQIIADLRIPE